MSLFPFLHYSYVTLGSFWLKLCLTKGTGVIFGLIFVLKTWNVIIQVPLENLFPQFKSYRPLRFYINFNLLSYSNFNKQNCSKVKINIAFMAGKTYPVEIESHTTCAQVCGVIEGAFNVKHGSQYCIFEVFGELGILFTSMMDLFYLHLSRTGYSSRRKDV